MQCRDLCNLCFVRVELFFFFFSVNNRGDLYKRKIKILCDFEFFNDALFREINLRFSFGSKCAYNFIFNFLSIFFFNLRSEGFGSQVGKDDEPILFKLPSSFGEI